MSIHSHSLKLALALACTSTASAQELLWSEPLPGTGGATAGNFGVSVARHADLDLDGIPEVASAAVGTSTIEVRAGSDGSLLRTIALLDPIAGKVPLLEAGDLNADGYLDLVVRTNLSFRALSGRNGAVLFDAVAPIGSFPPGAAAAPAGDVNGDGYGDLLVAWFESQIFGGGDSTTVLSGGPGLVELRSGLDGGLLSSYSVLGLGLAFGGCLATIPDVDGDGWDEVVIGRTSNWPGGAWGEALRAVSGRTGALLWRDRYGFLPRLQADRVDDLDGDGLEDLLVIAIGEGVRALSSATGHVLWSAGLDDGMTVGPSRSMIGTFVAPTSDADGDGVRDFWIAGPQIHSSAPFGPPRGQGLGELALISGATGLRLQHLPGVVPDAQIGHGVVVLGDRDGDGFDEIATAAKGTMRVEAYESGGTLSQPTVVCVGYGGDLDWLGSTSVAAADGSLALTAATSGAFWIGFAAQTGAYSSEIIPPFWNAEPFVSCLTAPRRVIGIGGPIVNDSGSLAVNPAALQHPGLVGTSWTFQAWIRYVPSAATPYGSSSAIRMTWTP